MPKEITKEEIKDVMPRALAASVKRSGDDVKFKLRTKKTLFTIKSTVEEASEIEKIITSGEYALEIEELS